MVGATQDLRIDCHWCERGWRNAKYLSGLRSERKIIVADQMVGVRKDACGGKHERSRASNIKRPRIRIVRPTARRISPPMITRDDNRSARMETLRARHGAPHCSCVLVGARATPVTLVIGAETRLQQSHRFCDVAENLEREVCVKIIDVIGDR